MARTRRPSWGDDPEFATDGVEQLDGVQARFRSLVERHAVQGAKRRGARIVDGTDVESAARHLLSPRDRPLVVDLLAESGLYAAGALSSYGVILLTASPPSHGPGAVMLVAGLFLGGLCATLKHISL